MTGVRQLRMPDPATRSADLAWVRSQLDSCNVRDVTPEQVETYYDAALADRRLAVDALIDVAAGRVNDELRALRRQEDH